MIDSNIQSALDVLVPAMQPEAIYLYGSRARGDAHQNSDYDFFVVMPDSAPTDKIDLSYTYNLVRHLPMVAEVIPCRQTYFDRSQSLLGSLGYNVIREGKKIYVRA